MREFEAEMAELDAEADRSFAKRQCRAWRSSHRARDGPLAEGDRQSCAIKRTHAAPADRAKALEQAKAAVRSGKGDACARRTLSARRRRSRKRSRSHRATEVAVQLEGKFAGERKDLLSKVRAAKALYQAQRAMMYSEVSKLQKAISVKEAQAADWHAKVTAIEARSYRLFPSSKRRLRMQKHPRRTRRRRG